MKIYPKKYEDVYSSKRTRDRCNIALLKIDKDIGLEDYKDMWRETAREFEKTIWKVAVKSFWLTRRFNYLDYPRDGINPKGFTCDAAFGVFMRTHVGYEVRFFSRERLFAVLKRLILATIKDFDDTNPFEKMPPMPFKNIALHFAVNVYSMDEWIELLRHADKEEMRYDEFIDFVFNYVMSYNEEHGDKYKLTYKYRSNIPGVVKNKHYEGTK